MQTKTVMKKQSGFARYQSPVQDTYIDVLDGVRAILVFLVGAFHIWQQSWLTPNFVLFGKRYSLDFLLSGFLLYLPYARAGRDGALPRTLPFLKKRFLRIWPSYALNVVLFFLLAIRSYHGNTAYMAKDVVTHLTFTHTFFFDTYYGSPINGALWTVGVNSGFI